MKRDETVWHIRPEHGDDPTAITHLLEATFPTPAEARLVERLRQAGHLPISLVVEQQPAEPLPTEPPHLLGHIAFSPVCLAGVEFGLGLAPLAVLSSQQGQGLGGALIRAGLAACREADCPAVVVLGEPGYYGRFGFTPASQWGLTDEYGGGNAFQALELRSGGMPTKGGLVRYGSEFDIFAE